MLRFEADAVNQEPWARLIEELCGRVLGLPFLQAGISGIKLRQPALVVLTLYAHQALSVGIPHCAGLLIHEQKEVIVGPARGPDGECLAVYHAVVHGRHVFKRSVPHRDGLAVYIGICDLVPGELPDRVRLVLALTLHIEA